MIRVDPITAAPDNTDRRVQFILIVSNRSAHCGRLVLRATVVDLGQFRHENPARRGRLKPDWKKGKKVSVAAIDSYNAILPGLAEEARVTFIPLPTMPERHTP
jgi:hypothetical protein